jgi:tetratricopeptide (TPR) repeat protein
LGKISERARTSASGKTEARNTQAGKGKAMRALRNFVLSGVYCLLLTAGCRAKGEQLGEEIRGVLKSGDWQAVLSELRSENQYASDPRMRLLAGHACIALNQNNEAARLFLSLSDEKGLEDWLSFTSSLAASEPETAVFHYLRGDALARLNRLEEAIVEFERCRELDVSFALAAKAEAVAYRLRGSRYANLALPLLLDVTRINSSCADAWADLGFYALLQKVPGQALEAYDSALRLNSQFSLAYIGRACALYGLGRFEEALESVQQAAALCPELADLCTQNQEMIVAGANRFLYEVEKYLPEEQKAGTTLEMRGFQHSEVDLGGEKVHAYILRPSLDRDSTRNGIGAIAEDLSRRLGKPIGELNPMVVCHGWGASAWGQKLHGATLAAAGGKDGVILLDIPEFRGGLEPDTSGIGRTVGMARAGARWHWVSDSASEKVWNVGWGFNDVLGHPVDYFGHSGGTEAFMKQGDRRDIPRWGKAMFAAYPLSGLPFVSVRAKEELAAKCERIVNFHTLPGSWSNTVSGPEGTVFNIEVSPGGKGLWHGDWTSPVVNEGVNPVYLLAGEVMHGAELKEMRRLAETYSNDPSYVRLNSLGAFWNTNRGLWGQKLLSAASAVSPRPSFSARTDDLAGMRGWQRDKTLAARDPAEVPVIMLPDTKQETLVNTLQQLEGAMPRFRADRGDLPLRVLVQGRDAANVESFLAKRDVEVAVPVLNRNLTELQIVANRQLGPTVGPFDAVIVTEKQPLERVPRSTELTTIAGGVKLRTTAGHLLSGDLPTTPFDRALAGEFAMTEQFRRGTVTWNEWFHAGPAPPAEPRGVAAERVSNFNSIPVASFGQEKIADVWHADMSDLSPTQIAQQTEAFARNLGVKDIGLRYTDDAKARRAADLLKQDGFSVHLFQGQSGFPPVEAVTLGMGMGGKNPVVVEIHGGGVSSSASRAELGNLVEELARRAPSNRYLVDAKDSLANIPALISTLGKDIGPTASGRRALLLGTGDLRSWVLASQLNDRGFEALKASPVYDALNLSQKYAFDAMIGIKPSVSPSVGPSSRGAEGIGASTPSTFSQPSWRRPTYDDFIRTLPGRTPVATDFDYLLQKGLLRPYTPPKPLRLPGGVTMEQFAKTWVDNGDWPLYIQCTLFYGGVVSLMR